MIRDFEPHVPAGSQLMPPLLGAFFVFATLMCSAAAWSLLVPNGPAASIWILKPEQFRQMLSFGPIVGVGFLLLAAVMAITSIGCFAAKRWGWRLAVAIIGINAVADGARAVTGEIVEGLIGLVIAAGVFWGLLRPLVRKAFRS